jgi:hypothetical protein
MAVCPCLLMEVPSLLCLLLTSPLPASMLAPADMSGKLYAQLRSKRFAQIFEYLDEGASGVLDVVGLVRAPSAHMDNLDNEVGQPLACLPTTAMMVAPDSGIHSRQQHLRTSWPWPPALKGKAQQPAIIGLPRRSHHCLSCPCLLPTPAASGA